MKKILMLLLLMFILPVMVVKADMGAPMIRPFDAYISNVNGAVVYDMKLEKDVMLEYGTEIKVVLEHYNDKKTVYAETKDEKTYIILIEDIVPLKEEFIIDENDKYIHKSEKITELTVLKEDGIRMYKGPSNGYSEIGDIIPKGTKLKYQYTVSDGWFYVEYNGVKGWVCELFGVLGTKEDKKMLVPKELEIVKEDKVVGKIPANIVLNSFYSVDPWSWKYYVTYNGISGYVDSQSVSLLHDRRSISVKNEKIMYEKADVNSNILVESIPANTKLEYEYMLGRHQIDWIYTTYNGKTGWVHYSYEEQNDIIFDNNENISTPADDANSENDFNINQSVENDDDFDNVDESNDNIVDESLFTGKQILLLCVGAAVVISLTAGVTVVLVNKKNKKKEEDIIDRNSDIV